MGGGGTPTLFGRMNMAVVALYIMDRSVWLNWTRVLFQWLSEFNA